jgi:hypothetical protein
MLTDCDVILRWDARPEQLRALGTALWGWCNGVSGSGGVSRQLDNQALADMIAGRLPASRPMPGLGELRRVRFRIQEESFQGRQAAIDGLRRAMPAAAVEDVLLNGASWDAVGPGTSRVTAS